jgi:putative glycosyltransferase (TIGR04372 family)
LVRKSAFQQVRERGPRWAIQKAFSTLIVLVLRVVAFVPALMLRIIGFRFLPIHTQRIGHLAIEPDCYLKEEALGLHPQYRACFCAPAHLSANGHLVEYWRSFFTVVRSRALCWLLKPLSEHPLLRFEVHGYAVALDRAAVYPALQQKWASRPPLLKLTEEDSERGRSLLMELGMPQGGWFVCVHSRESGYSPTDERWHSFRNSEIGTYVSAMKCIVERGGWCVRVGDPTMKSLGPMEGVIDYAHHRQRCDWMDIFLLASCKFLLGNTSGPYLVSGVFGVPVAVANLVPLGMSLPFGRNDLGIPKLLWSQKENRLLTFEEIFSSEISRARFASQYSDLGIRVVDNSPDEIAAMALEQLDRIAGTATYTDDDEELQRRFKRLMNPTHYTFGSESRIGRNFLRKYAHLLPASQ